MYGYVYLYCKCNNILDMFVVCCINDWSCILEMQLVNTVTFSFKHFENNTFCHRKCATQKNPHFFMAICAEHTLIFEAYH